MVSCFVQAAGDDREVPEAWPGFTRNRDLERPRCSLRSRIRALWFGLVEPHSVYSNAKMPYDSTTLKDPTPKPTPQPCPYLYPHTY